MAIVTDLLGRGLRGIFLPYAPPLVAFNSPFAISNFPTNTKVDQGLSVYTGSTMVLRFQVHLDSDRYIASLRYGFGVYTPYWE